MCTKNITSKLDCCVKKEKNLRWLFQQKLLSFDPFLLDCALSSPSSHHGRRSTSTGTERIFREIFILDGHKSNNPKFDSLSKG